MRQSKNHQKLTAIIFMIITLLLTIPKTNQINSVLVNVLSADELNFFSNTKHFLLFFALVFEIINISFNIFLLKLIYAFAKLNMTMIDNAILYLIASAFSKITSLLVPIVFLSRFPFINSLLFASVFFILHYLYQRKNTYTASQWLMVSSFPLINILFTFL